MTTIKTLKENIPEAKLAQEKRGLPPETVDQLLEAHESRAIRLTALEALRQKANAFNKELQEKLKTASSEEKATLLAEARLLKKELKFHETDFQVSDGIFERLYNVFPNLVHPEVKAGGEDDFTVVKTVTKGELKAGLHHQQIGEALDIIDIPRGVKLAGTRNYFLKGAGALLELGLQQLAVQEAVKAGFSPVVTPTLAKREVMEGAGFITHHEKEIYKLEDDDLYLTGTSEVALAGLHMGETIDVTTPLKYAGISSCYRREAGAAGKDTRGIMRVHQFNKVEMFVYCLPEVAEEEHGKLLAMEEHMLALVGLDYRVIDSAAGDLGMSAHRRYDCEAWMPSEGRYREMTSTSNCTTFQAERLKIRGGGATPFVATLNGTLATTRWLTAILEQGQTSEGVRVPEALATFVGTDFLKWKNLPSNVA